MIFAETLAELHPAAQVAFFVMGGLAAITFLIVMYLDGRR